MIRVLTRRELIAYRCLVKLKLSINYFFPGGRGALHRLRAQARRSCDAQRTGVLLWKSQGR
jgi:hypothetical protein